MTGTMTAHANTDVNTMSTSTFTLIPCFLVVCGQSTGMGSVALRAYGLE